MSSPVYTSLPDVVLCPSTIATHWSHSVAPYGVLLALMGTRTVVQYGFPGSSWSTGLCTVTPFTGITDQS
jgi:hypothetical protein